VLSVGTSCPSPIMSQFVELPREQQGHWRKCLLTRYGSLNIGLVTENGPVTSFVRRMRLWAGALWLARCVRWHDGGPCMVATKSAGDSPNMTRDILFLLKRRKSPCVQRGWAKIIIQTIYIIPKILVQSYCHLSESHKKKCVTFRFVSCQLKVTQLLYGMSQIYFSFNKNHKVIRNETFTSAMMWRIGWYMANGICAANSKTSTNSGSWQKWCGRRSSQIRELLK